MSLYSTIETDFTDLKDWIAKEVAKAPVLSTDAVDDVQLVGTALDNTLAAFTAVTGIDVSKVTALANSIVTAAKSVVSTIQQNIALPFVTQISTDWTAFTGALPAALPGMLNAVVSAINTLMPLILKAAGFVSTPAVLSAEAGGMSPATARLILKAA